MPKALRALFRRPGLVIGGVTILGLSIGLSAALFGLVRAVVLLPATALNANDVYYLRLSDARRKRDQALSVRERLTVKPTGYLTIADVEDLVRHPPARTTAVAGVQFARFVARSGRHAERVFAEFVIGDYARVFRLNPSAGRFLDPRDDVAGAPNVVVVSDRLWREWFAPAHASPGAATLLVDGKSLTVVGAAPAAFRGVFQSDVELWLPGNARRMAPDLAGVNGSYVGNLFVRAERGSSTRDVAASISQALERLPDPVSSADYTTMATTADSLLRRGELQPLAWMVLTFGALVLVIGCVNVANLMHAHFSARDVEFASRRAMGATVRSLIGLCLIDIGAMCAMGLALGVAIAWGILWAVRLLVPLTKLPGVRVPRGLTAYAASLEWPVLLYAVVAAAVMAVVVASVIGKRMLRVSRQTRLLTSGGFGASARTRTRRIVVAVQVAIATVTVLGTSAYVRAASPPAARRPMIDTAGVVSARVDLDLHGYSQTSGREFYDRLLERASAIPGAAAVALADGVPGYAYVSNPLFLIVAEPAPGAASNAPKHVVNGSYAGVSSGFFDVLRLPITNGRGFIAGDRYGAPLVTVVSDSVAGRLWPGADPIGRRLMFGNEGHWLTVVGVSADPVTTPDKGVVCRSCVVFVPFSQRYSAEMVMMIRPRGSSDLTPQLASALAAVDPDVIPFEPGSLDSTLLGALWLERAAVILVAAPGIVAILIAAFGIYSTTSYIVTLRSFEIAVRMALGAGPGAVVGLVMREVRLDCLLGLLAGVFVVASGERGLLASGTRFMPNDIPTWTIVLLILLAGTTLAAYLPARRSARVSPAAVLRK